MLKETPAKKMNAERMFVDETKTPRYFNLLPAMTREVERKRTMTKTVDTTAISAKTAARILRTVPPHNAFVFFIGIGKYTGKFATSLVDFNQKLRTIDGKSLLFHFKRRDFQKWIRTTIGDITLANRIDKINQPIDGATLREALSQITESRLLELKKRSASAHSFLEHQ